MSLYKFTYFFLSTLNLFDLESLFFSSLRSRCWRYFIFVFVFITNVSRTHSPSHLKVAVISLSLSAPLKHTNSSKNKRADDQWSFFSYFFFPLPRSFFTIFFFFLFRRWITSTFVFFSKNFPSKILKRSLWPSEGLGWGRKTKWRRSEVRWVAANVSFIGLGGPVALRGVRTTAGLARPN